MEEKQKMKSEEEEREEEEMKEEKAWDVKAQGEVNLSYMNVIRKRSKGQVLG